MKTQISFFPLRFLLLFFTNVFFHYHFLPILTFVSANINNISNIFIRFYYFFLTSSLLWSLDFVLLLRCLQVFLFFYSLTFFPHSPFSDYNHNFLLLSPLPLILTVSFYNSIFLHLVFLLPTSFLTPTYSHISSFNRPFFLTPSFFRLTFTLFYSSHTIILLILG